MGLLSVQPSPLSLLVLIFSFSFSFLFLFYRSVAHASLGEYSKALRDAERAIAVDSYWVKVRPQGKRERVSVLTLI